ncbi:MAG: M16 family metallopeptidase [Candidatus Neomarinimicrobiota bacterium]
MVRFTLIVILLISTSLFSKTQLTVEKYTLNNGLTVILNPDKYASKVFGAVAIKGGGKQDPADATGIAHYLEHMLFKGTDILGTVDYKSEKAYLDSIETFYNELGQTEDVEKRASIQEEINKLNLKASEFAIPNEFNRLIEGFGGTGVNAFTSNDIIAYVSQFPAHQTQKWLSINSHRFENPVFRLFQSELETVYEEKNRSMDNAFRTLFEQFFANFFRKHPYGQQTILGTKEHLKNPSIKKMKEYYDTYYISNNMTLMLAGNFDLKFTKEEIKNTFGKLKSGPDPEFVDVKEMPFNGREVVSKRLTPIRFGMIGFRVPPPRHEDYVALNIIRNLFNNSSSTGLLDRLSIENKLLGSSAISGLGGADHGAIGFMFIPKLIFQTFKGAENAVMNEIDKVKDGSFSEEYLQSIKLTIIKDHETGLENSSNRLNYGLDMILNDRKWEEIIDYPNLVQKMTKDEIVEVANKYFNENYLVYRSKIGFPKKDKVEKPPYKPVKPKNSEKVSEFAKRLEKIPSGKISIDYLDFYKDTEYEELIDNFHFYHNSNPINSIFSLRLEWGVGNNENNKLSYATQLGGIIGSEKFTFNEFKEELQKIGATVDFSNSGNYTGLNIRGFDKYFEQTINLAGDFLRTIKVRKEDKKKLKKLIQGSIIERKFEGRETASKADALKEYAIWGNQSAYLTRPTVKEVKKMSSELLINQIKDAVGVETNLYYTGTTPKEMVEAMVRKNFIISKNLRDSNSPYVWDKKLNEENTVYFHNDKKAVQSQIYIIIDGQVMDEKDRHMSNIFNKYFGGSMSGLVFQEIREFRSLAYSARGTYRKPFFFDRTGRFEGYMGTQADKTIDAIETYMNLLEEMPEKVNRMAGIKSGMLQSLTSSRSNFRGIGSTIATWQKQGFKEDPKIMQKEVYENAEFDDLLEFYKNYIQGRPFTITIVGNKEKIDFNKLSDYGNIIELKKEDIFN